VNNFVGKWPRIKIITSYFFSNVYRRYKFSHNKNNTNYNTFNIVNHKMVEFTSSRVMIYLCSVVPWLLWANKTKKIASRGPEQDSSSLLLFPILLISKVLKTFLKSITSLWKWKILQIDIKKKEKKKRREGPNRT
jgi:hypothetical protein